MKKLILFVFLLFPIIAFGAVCDTVEKTYVLSWNASTSTNVVGYLPYHGESPDMLTNVSSGLITGLTYEWTVKATGPHIDYFAVTAKNDLGIESLFSTIESGEVTQAEYDSLKKQCLAGLAPAAPTGLTVMKKDPGGV